MEAALACRPDHVSAYSLIVEPGTALARRVRRGELPMPDEDDLADKYLAVDERMSRAGLEWYEVSNWATSPDHWCRHNLLYWTGGHWWGVGPDGLPDVDEGVSDDQDVLADGGAGDALGDARLLGARHEVVDEDAHTALWSGPEVAQVVGQVVDPAEVLHHHSLDAQVVAPHLLDELGVVPALHEDAARPRHAGLCTAHGDRPGRRTGGLRRNTRAHRAGEDDRLALEQEAGAEGKRAALLAAVLESQRVQVAVDRDDLAAPVGGDLLHDLADLGRHLTRSPASGSAPVGGEDV